MAISDTARMMSTKQLLDVLYEARNSLDTALNMIARLENGISRKAEHLYMKAFAFQSDFDEVLSRSQLRCLWTAYAFHHELTVDTAEYDNELRELWDSINKNAAAILGNADWSCYEKFDRYMCQSLV